MKNFKPAILLICIFMLCSNISAKNPKWKLVWKDDFKKNGVIDKTKWSKIPRGTADWSNYMSSDESLYDVKKGNLILRGKVNDNLEQDSVPYITGGIFTKDKFTIKYGKVEIKAKLPNAKGCWPAFWMLPNIKDRKWPYDGEIDIMEHLNHDDIAYQTVHSGYTIDLGIKDNPLSHATAPMDKNGYNIYSVEKRPDKLVFAVNGKTTFEYPRIETDKEGQYPFDDPFYILIDMQLGGSWVGPIDDTELPVEMLVDWIKVYEMK
ncbi:MAG: glycoside hydrolase family 16 protein [Bacteroidales bacterium]|nr:glycoside hydrolase family 16 protein [Bacteroidales bacterium]